MFRDASVSLSRAAVLIAGAALFGAGAVQAQEYTAQASASLSNLRFDVVDLAPSDGIAAAYRIDEGATSYVSNYLRVSDRYEQFGGTGMSAGWMTPGSGALSYPGPGGEGATTASVGPVFFSASGSIRSADDSSFSAMAQAYSASLTNEHPELVGLALAPHSQLTISADYLLSTSVDGAPCSMVNRCVYTDASVGLNWGGQLLEAGSLSRSVGLVSYPPTPNAMHDSGRIDLTLTNNTGEWGSEYLVISATARGDITEPIPEPSTWALTAAGLAGLAFVRRRRAA